MTGVGELEVSKQGSKFNSEGE